MSSCYHFIVSGRVQGVFYRSSTQDKARKLGLTGWVRNLNSGEVELLACGNNGELERLKEWLWQGPKFAQVTGVKSECLSDADSDVQKGFEIRRDGG